MTIVDFRKARFDAAKCAADVTAIDALAEAQRRIEAGEWKAHSVIIIGMEIDDDGRTTIELVHGGPANTNERLAMYSRGQMLTMQNMAGDHDD